MRLDHIYSERYFTNLLNYTCVVKLSFCCCWCCRHERKLRGANATVAGKCFVVYLSSLNFALMYICFKSEFQFMHICTYWCFLIEKRCVRLESLSVNELQYAAACKPQRVRQVPTKVLSKSKLRKIQWIAERSQISIDWLIWLMRKHWLNIASTIVFLSWFFLYFH